MSTEISSKIVEVSLKSNTPAAPQPTAVVPDENPLTSRIESRPVGGLQAVSEKVIYNTQEGRKKLYLIVSFMPVSGVVGGQNVMVERPVEFFIPSGQLSSEQQWITASMRSLSLAARGGYVAQALQDLRKVVWDKGPVRCGVNTHGKPKFHDSEVAAIAWSIQKILIDRGFLTEDGEQIPLEQLSRGRKNTVEIELDPDDTDPADTISRGLVDPIDSCPECGGELVKMDGCPTCTSCGYSKCG